MLIKTDPLPSSKTRETWLIYALGGGWGHLQRSLSLGRIAARKRTVKIITNSPYAGDVAVQALQIYAIDPTAAWQTTCDRARQILLNEKYDCLIVDTFPRGLGGELAEIWAQLPKVAKILIHRDLNPDYIRAQNLRSLAAENYDLIIVPGEGESLPLADLPQVQHTAPWLIRSASELPNLETARSLLRLPPPEEQNLAIAVCIAGKVSELEYFNQLAVRLVEAFPQATIRCLAAGSAKLEAKLEPLLVSHWPAIECWQAANLVVGSAGYNTVCECAALGVPLIAAALPRLYDRQDQRASQAQLAGYLRRADTIKAAIEAISQLDRTPKPPQCPYYQNGAVQAEELINQAIASPRS